MYAAETAVHEDSEVFPLSNVQTSFTASKKGAITYNNNGSLKEGTL